MSYIVIISPSQTGVNTKTDICSKMSSVLLAYSNLKSGVTIGQSNDNITIIEQTSGTIFDQVQAGISNPTTDGALTGNSNQLLTLAGTIPYYTGNNDAATAKTVENFTNLRNWALNINHSNADSEANSRFVQVISYILDENKQVKPLRVYATNYAAS